MKTIKQIADELGVSKTAVRKKIENLGLSEKMQTNGNKILLNDRQESLIKSTFQKTETVTRKPEKVDEKVSENRLLYDLVTTLQKELEVKNEQLREKDIQLAEKNKQLEQVHKLIDQEQQLRMVSEQKLLLLEETKSKPKRHWWNRKGVENEK